MSNSKIPLAYRGPEQIWLGTDLPGSRALRHRRIDQRATAGQLEARPTGWRRGSDLNAHQGVMIGAIEEAIPARDRRLAGSQVSVRLLFTVSALCSRQGRSSVETPIARGLPASDTRVSIEDDEPAHSSTSAPSPRRGGDAACLVPGRSTGQSRRVTSKSNGPLKIALDASLIKWNKCSIDHKIRCIHSEMALVT